MAEKMLSVKKVAELLSVSERSIFRYIHDGKLKASKIGYWRIQKTDLDDFIAEKSNINRHKK